MDYVLGGYYRENNTRTLVFPRPTNVPDDAVAQLHIDVGADVVAYVMDTETIEGDVFDSFTAMSGLTEYVGGWRASIKYVAGNGDIWASGNFELNIKERVDGDEAIISANPDVLEALQATVLDHEARIAAIEAASGTGSHNSLSGRDAEDAHPISAITGLSTALDKKIEPENVTAGTNIDVSILENDVTISVEDTPTFGGIHFDTSTPMVASTAGDIAFNVAEGTFDMHLIDGVTLQAGQELHIFGKASGNISNGDVVQFNGAEGNHIKIKKAVPAEITANPHYLLGVATENITSGAFGYVTRFGNINGVFTTGWTAGQKLWYDNVTGAVTNVEPSSGVKIELGSVIRLATGGSENGRINILVQRIYSAADVGADPAGTAASAVSAHNISGTAHADLRPVAFAPATMTVNAGTLNAGTVADLAAVGGTDVSIQELNGTDPLTITFGFTGVTRLSNVHLYLDYIGGASHVINCEIYNVNTTNWDVLGSFDTTEGKVWRSFEIFTPNSYINAGAVSMRLRHLSTGINTHQLIIDYLDVNAGGGGGIGYVGAASVNFAPAGNISSTNVQTALVEIDNEKAPIAMGVTNGDTHDHSGGDGGQIAYSSLSGTPTSMTPTAHKTTHATGGTDALTSSDIGAEPSLGNPSTSGYVLSSTTEGTRSWIEMTGGTGGDTYPRGTSFPASPTAGDAFYRTDRKVLYVYEGGWQPIESYGDITLYLSSTGNDANTGWSAGDPVATVSRLWDMIPRLYGGNVTVNVSGTIEGSSITLGGKYPVAGAYTIAFVGVEGSVVKSSFTGTVNESSPAYNGLISGLSGLTTNAYRGMILKNVTRDWQTVIFENSTSSIRAVGVFNTTSFFTRTAASSDTWEVRNFGAKINHRIIATVPIALRNLETVRVDARNCTQGVVDISTCYTNVATYAWVVLNSVGMSIFDSMAQTTSGLALSVTSGSGETTIANVGMISTSSMTWPLVSLTSSSLYVVDVCRLVGVVTGSWQGLLAEKSSFVRVYRVTGSWIKSFAVGLEAKTFSAITGLNAASPNYEGTITQTVVDGTTANGTIT